MATNRTILELKLGTAISNWSAIGSLPCVLAKFIMSRVSIPVWCDW